MPTTIGTRFEKFLGGPTQPVDERLHVSIDRRGVITFNARCYRELGKPTAVCLHFSRTDHIIAIEPVNGDPTPAAFPLRPNGTAFYLNSAPFCRHFGIMLDGSYRFIAPEFSDGAMLLNLKETVEITRVRRWQKKNAA